MALSYAQFKQLQHYRTEQHVKLNTVEESA